MQLMHSYRMLAHTGIRSAVLLALGLLLVAWPGPATAREEGRAREVEGDRHEQEKPEKLAFDMVVAAGAQRCLPNATGHVSRHRRPARAIRVTRGVRIQEVRQGAAPAAPATRDELSQFWPLSAQPPRTMTLVVSTA